MSRNGSYCIVVDEKINKKFNPLCLHLWFEQLNNLVPRCSGSSSHEGWVSFKCLMLSLSFCYDLTNTFPFVIIIVYQSINTTFTTILYSIPYLVSKFFFLQTVRWFYIKSLSKFSNVAKLANSLFKSRIISEMNKITTFNISFFVVFDTRCQGHISVTVKKCSG